MASQENENVEKNKKREVYNLFETTPVYQAFENLNGALTSFYRPHLSPG